MSFWDDFASFNLFSDWLYNYCTVLGVLFVFSFVLATPLPPQKRSTLKLLHFVNED